MSVCAIQHPITFLLAILKVLGGFPYNLKITQRITNIVPPDERNPEVLEPKQLITIKRSYFATAWSIFLVVVVIIGSCLAFLSYDGGATDTESTLLSVFICITAMCAGLHQVSLLLHSKNLVDIVILIQKDIMMKFPRIHRIFLPLYLTLVIDFLAFTFIIVLILLFFSKGNISPNTIAFVNTSLVVLFFISPPIACVGVLSVVSKTMAISLNAEMNDCFNKLLHSDQDVPPCLRKSRSFGRITDVASIENTEKTSENIKKVSKLLMRTDMAIKALERYGSEIVIISIIHPLYTLVYNLYTLTIILKNYSAVIPVLYMAFKLITILCSTESLASERQVWLDKLQQISVLDNNIRCSSEVQFIISQLERGRKFSPCQLFTLGRHCIIPIISTVLTYIIIVLQFKLSEGVVEDPYCNATNFCNQMLNKGD